MKNKNYPLYENAPKITSLTEMLELKAKDRPNETGIRFRKGRKEIVEKTYLDVYREVRRAASWVDKNFDKGSHVAVIGENSYEWLVAYLAVVCTGRVAVPIDKELPAGEVEWLINKADVTKIFISKSYSDLVENLKDLQVMTLDELYKISESENEDFELYKPDKDELASIFFTSGTSGRSKGVMLSHGNIASEINGASAMFDPEGRSTLVVLPFHHTFGLIVATLMAYNYGENLFLNKSLKRIKEDLADSKPDLMMLVPLFVETFYKRLCDGIEKSGQKKRVETGVKVSQALLKVGIDRRRSMFKAIIEFFGGNLKWRTAESFLR